MSRQLSAFMFRSRILEQLSMILQMFNIEAASNMSWTVSGVISIMMPDAGVESIEDSSKSGWITFQGVNWLRFEFPGKCCPEVGRVDGEYQLVSGESDAVHHDGDVAQHSGLSEAVHEIEIHGGMEAGPNITDSLANILEPEKTCKRRRAQAKTNMSRIKMKMKITKMRMNKKRVHEFRCQWGDCCDVCSRDGTRR